MINKERLLNTFIDYVQIDSETKNERAMGERVISDLEKLGLKVYTDKAGKKLNSNMNNIYCSIPGTTSEETMLFSAHIDTVSPGVGIVPYIDGNYVKSKGKTILGADDKAGVVAILEALRTIKQNNLPHRTIEIVFSICEEGGVNGVKNVEFNKLTAKKGIVLDSGGSPGEIIIQAPGQTKIHASITGKAAHAGSCPEAGVSAIMVGAEAIANMKLLRIDYETTSNIGTFKAIGATNIVSERAEIIAEARSLSNEKLKNQTNHIIDCLLISAEKYGAKVEYDVEETYLSYVFDENDEYLEMIAAICNRLGLEVAKIPSGGGSDANIYNKNGIKTLNIGCGMELVHTVDEQLNINDFEDAARVVLELMKQ